jgi:hypothetical protein
MTTGESLAAAPDFPRRPAVRRSDSRDFSAGCGAARVAYTLHYGKAQEEQAAGGNRGNAAAASDIEL